MPKENVFLVFQYNGQVVVFLKDQVGKKAHFSGSALKWQEHLVDLQMQIKEIKPLEVECTQVVVLNKN